MRKNIFIAILLLMFAIALPSDAKPQGTINVNASSNLELQPDVAEFNIIITTKDKLSLENASIANKEISTKIFNDFETILDKSQGEFIKTINYSANPKYYYTNGKRVFDKFEVTNTITIHTKKINDVGMFIDKALRLGATNIGNINFTLEDYENYCNELLSLATQKAKTKAETVANASGQKILGAKEIHTSCNVNGLSPISRYALNSKMTTGATEDAVIESNSTRVQGGTIKLYANVNASYFTK